MYYRECTKAYAIEVINEIITAVECDGDALYLIEKFIQNEFNTDDIASFIEEQE